jgi:hypothetical protein
MFAVGSQLEAPGCFGFQIQLFHDTSDLVAADLMILSLQLFNDPAGTITAPGFFKYLFDSLAKKAAAFFKISRSIKRRLFSFLRKGVYFLF